MKKTRVKKEDVKQVKETTKELMVSFKFRALNIIVALACVILMNRFFGFKFGRAIIWTFSAWLITCLVYLGILSRNIILNQKGLDLFHFVYYFAGITYVTVIVHFTGGLEWIVVISSKEACFRAVIPVKSCSALYAGCPRTFILSQSS